MSGAAGAHAHAASFDARRRRFALMALALAFILDILDGTVVNLAAPSIRASLGASDATLQWLVAGYALSFSMLLILGGRLGDLLGYRRMFLIGVAAFAATSGFCGLAASQGQLVFARIFQGAAAAIMVPQVLSLVQLLYPPHERGTVMGVFGALGGLSASLGPVLGGVLIHADLFHLAWRPIFLINLPVSALALLGGVFFLPQGRSPRASRPDILGAALVMAALFLVVYPLIQGRELGWPTWILAMVVAGAAFAAAFVLHIRRRGETALAPPSLFRDHVYRRGLLVVLALQTALNGYFLTFSLTLQLGLRLDVLTASLTTLPFAIGVGVGVSLISRKLAVKLGRRLSVVGMGVLTSGWLLLGLILHAFGPHAPPIWLSAPILALGGLGMGMANGPMSALVLSEVDMGHVGAASGVLSATQQLGAAAGAAVIGALYFRMAGPANAPAGLMSAFPFALSASALLVVLAAVGARGLPETIRRRPAAPAH